MWKSQIKTKICNTCKKKFPKTGKYFFTKNQRNTLADGTIGQYKIYRSDCKSCHAEKAKIRQQRKRCKELGCDIKDYQEKWREQMVINKSKYPEILHLPESIRISLRRWIDDGYKFTTYEQYRLDVRKQASKLKRKYDYKTEEPLTNKQKNDMAHKILTKSRIALTLGMPTEELPDKLYENIKLTTQLKRVLGMTHSTIKELNINNKYSKKWKCNAI